MKATPETADMSAGLQPLAEEASVFLRSLASPYRLVILTLLLEREHSVKELCEALDARQSLVSQHLTRLRLAGIVKAERRGASLYYSLVDEGARALMLTLSRHFRGIGSSSAS